MSDLVKRLRHGVIETSHEDKRRGFGIRCEDVATDRVMSEAADEIERLQADVAKLPKTKDGVPIIPLMTVYRPDGSGSVKTIPVDTISLDNRVWYLQRFRVHLGRPGDCYSTREAAEAAMEQDQNKEDE